MKKPHHKSACPSKGHQTCGIGIPLTICHLNQDKRSKRVQNIVKFTKTKKVKHLLSKINLAQQYFADKLSVTVQTPTEEMIADASTKPEGGC